MLSKQYRLRKNDQIQELRRDGRSWHNPLLVLIGRNNDRGQSRFAFSVSRRIGNAVVRNRLKRLMRESVRCSLPHIQAGWDILLVARRPSGSASFAQVERATTELLHRAHLWQDPAHRYEQTTQPNSVSSDGQKAAMC